MFAPIRKGQISSSFLLIIHKLNQDLTTHYREMERNEEGLTDCVALQYIYHIIIINDEELNKSNGVL